MNERVACGDERSLLGDSWLWGCDGTEKWAGVESVAGESVGGGDEDDSDRALARAKA